MATRLAHLFRREPRPRRETTPHFSQLQKAILCWLYREGQRRQRRDETTAIPFATLVHGLNAEKTEIVMSLRRLMKKAFVEVSLPRGEWTRYVSLTEQGEKHAKTLSKDTQTSVTSRRSPGKRDRGHEGERRRS
jgi:DNA-binding MarR family transcriptional regulator